MIFDRALTTSATIRNAGTVNANEYGGGDVNTGAFLIGDADAVNFLNTGSIRAFNTETTKFRNELTSAVRVVNADTILFRNEGRLEAEGLDIAAAFLEGRTIDFTNTGTVTATTNTNDTGSTFGFPIVGLAVAKPGQPANLTFNNSGSISAIDASTIGNAYLQVKENIFFLYGNGAVDFTNSGQLNSAGFNVSAGARNDGETITMHGLNTGAVRNTLISFSAGSASSPEPFLYRATDLYRSRTDYPVIAQYGSANIDWVNEGPLDTASVRVGASADDSRVSFINRGDVTGTASLNDVNSINGTAFQFTFAAGSDAPLFGSALTNFVNEGDVTLTDGFYHRTIAASSTHTLSAINRGDIRLINFDGDTYGLEFDQGTIQENILDSQGNFLNEQLSYVFDGSLSFDNSGLIDLNSHPYVQASAAVVVSGASDVSIRNSGAVTNTSVHEPGFTNDPYTAVGMVITAASDLSLVNSAPISVSTPTDANSAGFGMYLAERSLTPAYAATLTSNGLLRGYDQAQDLASRFDITLAAGGNISGSGTGSYGIFGVLGATLDSGGLFGDDRLTDSNSASRITNNLASAVLSVAGGASVSGGSADGVAVAFSGAGAVRIDNAGSIISHGDGTGGALVFGRQLDFNNHLLEFPAANPALSLAATINNAATGLIDGRIELGGAGSSFSNAGILRLSSGASSVSSLNGAFTQASTGALALRGVDRFNVAGNFALGGDLNLALGAPTGSAIIAVGGNLALDARLNVADAGGFGSGVYRLFDYGGTLSGPGITSVTSPGGFRTNVQTSVAGQVNLLVGSGNQFWDGSNTTANNAIDGGVGAWNTSTANWTIADGSVNSAWESGFAVFQGAAGTVTIASTGVSASGLQFAVGGYRIEGGTLNLTAPGTLRVGDGSAAGSGYTATIASVIAGSGGIEKTDLGTLVLTAANVFSGGTRISGGVLDIASDGALGATSGNVTLDGGTLRASGAVTSARGFAIGAMGGVIDTQANAVSLSGILSGTGRLTKVGAGTLTLSANSGAYAGLTTVSAGTLAITGTLGGNAVVDAGLLNVSGTLTGNATINGGTLNVGGTVAGSTSIAAGARLTGAGTLASLNLAGTLAPGNSIGTLSASGNVVFRAGSFYDVELAAAGGTDLLRTSGTATIEGGTVRITALDPETQYIDGTRYTILTATGGRTGTFAGLNENSAFLDFALSYGANDAALTVSVIRTFPDVARTFNQTQASIALKDLGKTAGSDSLAVYNTFLLLDENPARAAFDASSGEIYAALLTSEQRRGAALAAGLIEDADAPGADGWFAWVDAVGQDGSVSGDGNGARFEADSFGAAFGVGYRGDGNHWALGAAGGYTDGDVTLAARRSAAEHDGWHLGAIARIGTGGEGFTLTGSAAYASIDADVTRGIEVGSLLRTTRASTEVETFALSAEARYGFSLEGGVIGPVASLTHVDTDLGGFGETGANALNLFAGDNSDTRLRYTAGVFGRMDLANGTIETSVRYLGGDLDNSEVTLTLAGSPATPFRVRPARGDRSAALLTVSGDFEIDERWSLSADLHAIAGDTERAFSASVVARLRF